MGMGWIKTLRRDDTKVWDRMEFLRTHTQQLLGRYWQLTQEPYLTGEAWSRAEAMRRDVNEALRALRSEMGIPNHEDSLLSGKGDHSK